MDQTDGGQYDVVARAALIGDLLILAIDFDRRSFGQAVERAHDRVSAVVGHDSEAVACHRCIGSAQNQFQTGQVNDAGDVELLILRIHRIPVDGDRQGIAGAKGERPRACVQVVATFRKGRGRTSIELDVAAGGIDQTTCEIDRRAAGEVHHGRFRARDARSDRDRAAAGIADVNRSGGDAVQFRVGQAEGAGCIRSAEVDGNPIRLLSQRHATAALRTDHRSAVEIHAVTDHGRCATASRCRDSTAEPDVDRCTRQTTSFHASH